jgi:hypothetical protein
LKTNAATTAAELNKQLGERDQKISALEVEHHNYICQEDFEKLLNADPSIIPEMRDALKTVFFNNNQFEWVEVNGEKKLLNKGSKPMKDALTEYLNTPAGQYFRTSKNNGGGAAGSSGARGNGNSVNREAFDAMNEQQRNDFIRKGGIVASR